MRSLDEIGGRMAAEFAPQAGACSPCALGYVAGMPGILLLDSGGFVLRKNQIAEKLLSEQSVLSVRDDRLTTPYRVLQQWLDRATVAATGEGASMNRSACSARFSARDGMVDLALTLLPRTQVELDQIAVPTSAATVGVLTSLKPREEHSEVLVQGLFGLTRGEARLVVALVGCGSLDAAARSIGIKVSTARDRLKSVFRKTELASQSALIATVLRSPTREPTRGW